MSYPLRFSIFARRFPIKIFEFSREEVGVIKTYGGSYFLDIGLLITADHLTGAFHAHLVDVLEQADAGLFGEQAAQIFPVQPYIVGNAVQRQFVHIMRVYIDDDGLHLFFEFAQGNFAKSYALLQNQAEQLFKSL